MKIVYGPVASWRLGESLGVDLTCQPGKICTFDCIYCQLAKTIAITTKKDNYINTSSMEKELQEALKQKSPDVITLSGMGEPTLAKNIDEVINIIRRNSDVPIAILTNSTLFNDIDVQNNLKKIDIIVAKLDASNEKLFQEINQPATDIKFNQTINGIKNMRKQFKGKFAIQTMFLENNKNHIDDFIKLMKEIQPDELQINTPLRPTNIKPLSRVELKKIEKEFADFNTINVYDAVKPKVKPLEMKELYRRSRMKA
jgi:wyosine [tRNA(Phe)-imidazoG37] synthetase (radical SAM superfamily)